MSTRVLATEQARQAITQMQQVLNGPLSDTLRQLDQLGQTLSEPNNWDGRLAAEFRGQVWPGARTATNTMLQKLEELRNDVSKITQNIMEAGGNQ